jgi:hypothetical protein
MQKAASTVVVFFMSLFSLFAQKENFGIINYTAPLGYEIIKNDNAYTYYKEDKATGAYCNIFIYKLMPGQGNAQQDFNNSWDGLMQKPFKITATPVLQPEAVLKGWKFIIGTATYKENGVSALAMVTTFSGENKLQTVVILSNSESYKTDIENFIASIDVAKEIAVTASTANQNTSSATNNTVNPASQKVNNTGKSKARYNLWMAHKLSATAKLGDISFQYVVISSDNRCLYHFPEKGLLNIEQEYSGSDSWGTVTDKGDRLLLSNDKYGKMDLYKRTTGMGRYADSKPSDYYKKCKPVDGLRIEGAYSPDVSLYTKKSNAIDKAVDDPNKRAIIFFKKDGTYINEGISFSNITKGDDFAIGKGTYEMKDFSLILTTQSGRKLQTSFAAILDANPGGSTDGYIINQNLFYKLDASVKPH